jgi:hypothetical protein
LPDPAPRTRKHFADGDRLPVSRRLRWAMSAGGEAFLIVLMLLSDARWLVRIAVIVLGALVLASMHAYWREHGMPADGTP